MHLRVVQNEGVHPFKCLCSISIGGVLSVRLLEQSLCRCCLNRLKQKETMPLQFSLSEVNTNGIAQRLQHGGGDQRLG